MTRGEAELIFEFEVGHERKRQDEKWGIQTHSGHSWVSILTEELGEFAAAVNDGEPEQAEAELVQIAAVCRAAYAQSRAGNLLVPDFGTFTKLHLEV